MTINDAVQTVMSLTQKEKPVLPHLSAMLMSLYYFPQPQHILELGLGGGSMQRFFRHYFPQSSITTVENDAAVIRLFQDWFSENRTDHDIRFEDAQDALKHPQKYDFVIVDLFSRTGSPDFLNDTAFYQQCLTTLSEQGVLVMNLIVQYQLQANLIEDILKESGLKVRFFSVPGYQNRILIASRTNLSKVRYNAQLQSLALTYGLDLNGVIAN